jgi:transposase InsO family protein
MEMMKEDFSIEETAEALGVSKSGFHAHRQKARRPRRVQDEALRALVAGSFARSRQTYGCLRVRQDLRELGHRCGKNRVARLMREAGLRPRQKRRFRPSTTDGRHGHPIAPNWLAKVPAPDRPGQVWQSDMTCIETGEGWLYLAFTLDAASRRCVAHQCRADMDAELVVSAFDRAVARHKPPGPGLIHHSDRGSQYASGAFRDRLAACEVTASMSRKGNPYDNALSESFVATLKTECFAGVVPPTRASARLMVFDYIEGFYNTHRRHSSLGYLSPAQFERALEAATGEGCSGGGGGGGETCPPSRSALAAPDANNSPGVVRAAGNNPATPTRPSHPISNPLP